MAKSSSRQRSRRGRRGKDPWHGQAPHETERGAQCRSTACCRNGQESGQEPMKREHHKGRIKTRLPLLCPTGCLFLQTQIFQPESPTHLTTFQPNPTRILPAALRFARCCFCSCPHTFARPRCPLIPRPHIRHPARFLLLLFLPQATHTGLALHTHNQARGSSVVQQLSLCSLSTVQPRDFICHKDSGTRGNPPLSLDPDSSIHLALMPSGMSAMVMPRTTETMPGYSHFEMDEIHTPSRYFCFFSTVLGGPFLLFPRFKPVMIKACFPTLSNRRPPQ